MTYNASPIKGRDSLGAREAIKGLLKPRDTLKRGKGGREEKLPSLKYEGGKETCSRCYTPKGARVYPLTMEQKLIGYIRVSTDRQYQSGAGLEAQVAYIKAEASRRGAELEIVSEGEGASGKSMSKRSALNEAMARLDKGEATALIVYKLDRLSRSVADFLTVLERSRKGKWALIIGDLSIDTSTPMGEAMATISATFAQLESRKISERTIDGMREKKLMGSVFGRPVLMNAQTVEKIINLHKEGKGFNAIARQLNLEAVPTAQGGANWYPSTVSKTLARVS